MTRPTHKADTSPLSDLDEEMPTQDELTKEVAEKFLKTDVSYIPRSSIWAGPVKQKDNYWG